MTRGIGRIVVFLLAAFPLALIFAFNGAAPREAAPSDSLRKVPVYGDAHALRYEYEKWKKTIDATEPVIHVALEPSTVLNTRSTTMLGAATIDLRTGTIAIATEGLADTSDLDVWIVGRSDTRSPVALGRVHGDGPGRSFDVAEATGFRLDKLVLTDPGARPEDGAVLVGVPSLFQRFLVAEWTFSQAAVQGGGMDLTQCAEAGNLQDLLNECVIAGEELFTGKNADGFFSGNGRTCSTCHRPENNYTIDPDFIATLDASDPLFIAETDPNLNYDTNGGYWFEVPHLLRQRGLILANIDGDSLDRYVLRGVPHLLGVGRSLDPPPFPPDPTAPDHLLGWSGDGSPIGTPYDSESGTLYSSGSLHDFALGAVKQHFTRTLARTPGDCNSVSADFCYPNDEQLTQIEAFLLSLGRREETSLPHAAYGFATDPGDLNLISTFYGCNNAGCHVQGGGAQGPSTANSRLGTEDYLHCREFADPLQPFDGGRGQEEYTTNVTCPPGPCDPYDFDESDIECLRDGSFGDQTFNAPAMFVAAETAPYFHNNMVRTLEDVFRFYNSPEFMRHNHSILAVGPGLDCEPPNSQAPECQIPSEAIDENAQYLRFLAVIDNIDSQITPPVEKAKIVVDDPGTYDTALVPELAAHALFNFEDALDLLVEASLYQEPGGAYERLEIAEDNVEQFLKRWNSFGTASSDYLEVALYKLDQSRRIMTGRPMADDDLAFTTRGLAVVFSVVANDIDYNGTIEADTVDLDPATAGRQTTFTVPGQGTFTADDEGEVSFTPLAWFTGTSTITYTVQDNHLYVSNEAPIEVRVNSFTGP